MSTTARVAVRPAQEEDLPRLMALFYQLAASSSRHAQAVVWEAGDRQRELLAGMRDNPDYHLLVLEADGEAQGTCTLYLLPDLDRGGSRWAVVEHVVVDEQHRGHGFGKMLMTEAIRLAREGGCYKVSLVSGNQRLDTHRFYEGIGFGNRSKGFSVYFE